MENASKALIIAGAILLSILIIGLGMAVYNNASSSTGKSDLSGQEVSAHNSTFEAYEGRIKGSQVRTLLTAIANNNDEYEDRKITVTFENTTEKVIDAKTGSSDIRTGIKNISNSSTYLVKFEYGGNDNIIDVCTINVYGATSGDSGD